MDNKLNINKKYKIKIIMKLYQDKLILRKEFDLKKT